MTVHGLRRVRVSARGAGGLLLMAALATGSLGCKPPEEGAGEASTKQVIKPIAVEVSAVRSRLFKQSFEFPGVAHPIDERRVAAESSGRILDAPFEEGAIVEKGDLMLRVDAKTTAAQISVLRAQVSTAKRENNRLKQLAAEGLATPQQLDQSSAQLQQAELGLKQARVGQSMSTVRSPFTGQVAVKYLDRGEFAAPGQPIADLVDISTIKMEVTIPESAVAHVKVGDDVDVHFTATGERYKGKVKRRGVRVVQPTQTFPVEVHIPNPDGAILPGMRARVLVPKLTIPDAIVVSRDALLEGVLQREAMVLEDREGDMGKARLRVVELGESRGNEVVVTSGLKEGDVLIVTGHRNVVDGTPVRIVREHASDGAKKEATSPKPADNAGAASVKEEDER